MSSGQQQNPPIGDPPSGALLRDVQDLIVGLRWITKRAVTADAFDLMMITGPALAKLLLWEADHDPAAAARIVRGVLGMPNAERFPRRHMPQFYSRTAGDTPAGEALGMTHPGPCTHDDTCEGCRGYQ